MYRLNNINQTTCLADEARGEARWAWQYANSRLADATAGLEFEAVTHTYSICGTVIPSVSTIVEHFDPFDSVACAMRCAKNPRHELFGRTVRDIIEIWQSRGRAASDAGTQIHEFGEACFLCKAGMHEKIGHQLRPRLSSDGTLEATTPKEEALARWWDSLDLRRYVLIAKEARVYNPRLRYAGTFDLLLYDLVEHFFVLKDYKTNKELFRCMGDRLKAPLTPIKADNAGKYTVQQNLYVIELENLGIHVGAMDLVWLKDDATFQEVSLPECGKLVAFAAEEYLKTNQRNSLTK